jgi:hypothetical protein
MLELLIVIGRALASATSSERWRLRTRCGEHRGFMANCVSSVSTSQNARCRVCWNGFHVRVRRHGGHSVVRGRAAEGLRTSVTQAGRYKAGETSVQLQSTNARTPPKTEEYQGPESKTIQQLAERNLQNLHPRFKSGRRLPSLLTCAAASRRALVPSPPPAAWHWLRRLVPGRVLRYVGPSAYAA